MVKVQYDHRFVVDEHFIRWVQVENLIPKVTSQLMHIKASSAENKGTHNCILQSQADRIVADKILTEPYMGAMCKSYADSLVSDFKSDVSKVVILAVQTTFSAPCKTIILTSPEKLPEYTTNPHFIKCKDVSAKAGQGALGIIELSFLKFCTEREQKR